MLHNLVILPFKQFFDSLNSSERILLYILLAAALTLGFLLGRRRHRNRRGYKSFGLWRFPFFQNPMRQNYKHLLAVRSQLEFVPPEAIKSIVVFSGNAQFKTYVPPSVVHIDELIDFVKAHSVELLSLKRMQYAVGKLETVRLALSKQTDVDHVENLRRRFGHIVER